MGSPTASTTMRKDLTGASHNLDVEHSSDAYVVDWNGPNDPENPMNWPFWRKSGVITCVSIARFITWVSPKLQHITPSLVNVFAF
jgi:MFS transporter, DHA1 family, multidrug resistance protein